MHPIPFLLLIQDTSQPGGAPAGGPPGGAAGQLLTFVPYLLIGVVFWLILIRPEQKNRKKRLAMLAAIKKGDKVMTSGGLYGTVVQVQDQVVTLQVADGVRMRFAQSAIQSVEEESTEKVGEVKPT